MSRVIDVPLSVTAIQQVIDELNDRTFYSRLANAILNRLTQIGIEKARIKFANAKYAGELKPVDITATVNGNKAEIKAHGEQVLFIEFGTGVRYENPHMLEYDFYAGSYGDGHGHDPWGWWYWGSPQPNDPEDTEVAKRFDKDRNVKKEREGWMHTYGNPANMPMYETQKELEGELINIVREAWNDIQA